MPSELPYRDLAANPLESLSTHLHFLHLLNTRRRSI